MQKFTRKIALFFIIISVFIGSANAATTLIPGGQLIGLQLQDNTVTVAGFDENLGDAAQSAGLQKGDRIVKINDKEIHRAEDVRKALQSCDNTVDIRLCRDGKTKKATLRPPLTKDGPRLGVYLKQGTTGVGTVTYYDPETKEFAALGHGVNVSGGALLKLEKGTAYEAQILSVKKGKAGTPGQLMGALTGSCPIGSVDKNTAQGVFGKAVTAFRGDALPVAESDEIQKGNALIRCTVKDTLQEYSVQILKIYPHSPDRCRNMLIKITDPALLSATGGIVQGMSGSPIIQNGKLIGAVTHVLVNDPTMGYGIFIENMLDAA